MVRSIWCTNRNFRNFGLNGKRAYPRGHSRAIQTSLRIPNNLDVHLLTRTHLVLQDVCPIYLFRFPWVLELTSACLWLPKQKLSPCWDKCLDIRLGYLRTYYSWNLPAVWRINCRNLFILWSAQLVIFTCCRISWQKNAVHTYHCLAYCWTCKLL